MRKRELWAFFLLAAAGIAGFAYQQHGKALDFNKANCLADNAGRADAEDVCQCFVDALDRKVSFAYSIPLVGPMFAPREVKNGEVTRVSLNECGA